MALYKRGKLWWINISHCGKRIQKTTGTEDKIAAQQYHDKFKAELWKMNKLEEQPKKAWKDAVVRWFSEMQHKRSLYDDRLHVKWLDKYLGDFYLIEITKDRVDEIAKEKEAEGVKPATVNRMMALLKAILRKAANEWEWIDKIPLVRMRKVESKRIERRGSALISSSSSSLIRDDNFFFGYRITSIKCHGFKMARRGFD